MLYEAFEAKIFNNKVDNENARRCQQCMCESSFVLQRDEKMTRNFFAIKYSFQIKTTVTFYTVSVQYKLRANLKFDFLK